MGANFQNEEDDNGLTPVNIPDIEVMNNNQIKTKDFYWLIMSKYNNKLFPVSIRKWEDDFPLLKKCQY